MSARASPTAPRKPPHVIMVIIFRSIPYPMFLSAGQEGH